MTKSFYERYWDRDDKQGQLSDFQLKWPILQKLIPKEKSIAILDFGCGNGFILREMMKINPDARYVGVDVSRVAIAEARQVLPNLDFHEIEDGAPVPLKDSSVDFIFSSEVIEHIYDTENAVREWSRILKPGGKVLLTTPYHGFLKNLLITIFGFDKHFNPTGPHVRFFSKKTLFNLLEKNKLMVEGCGYYGRFYPISHSIFVLAKKLAHE
ncbi:MAG: methyltransferase domain-containing protein [Patescibacteria group bacterium]